MRHLVSENTLGGQYPSKKEREGERSQNGILTLKKVWEQMECSFWLGLNIH